MKNTHWFKCVFWPSRKLETAARSLCMSAPAKDRLGFLACVFAESSESVGLRSPKSIALQLSSNVRVLE